MSCRYKIGKSISKYIRPISPTHTGWGLRADLDPLMKNVKEQNGARDTCRAVQMHSPIRRGGRPGLPFFAVRASAGSLPAPSPAAPPQRTARYPLRVLESLIDVRGFVATPSTLFPTGR